MAVQFNLLPDVKLQYLKAERTRRVVVSISILVTLAAIALMVLLFSVTQIQRKHLRDLSKDIKSDSAKLEGQTDLNKILTVQNQLSSLTDLHNQKPATTRLFTYLAQIVPDKVNANNLTIDFAQNTVTISGTADSLSTVNKFVDTLKFTKFTVGDDETGQPAFSNVVLSSFGLAQNQAAYTVTFSYDPAIFDLTKEVQMVIPNLVTTRSEVDKPSELFVQPTNTKAGQ